MRYLATIFVELRDLDVTRIAEADREVQSLLHREGFEKHGSNFVGPTNREADELRDYFNNDVFSRLEKVGRPYAEVIHHRKV